jgi:hypothetical protein
MQMLMVTLWLMAKEKTDGGCVAEPDAWIHATVPLFKTWIYAIIPSHLRYMPLYVSDIGSVPFDL